MNGGIILLLGFSYNSAILSRRKGGQGTWPQPSSRFPVGNHGHRVPWRQLVTAVALRAPSGPAGLLPGLGVRRRRGVSYVRCSVAVLREGRRHSGPGYPWGPGVTPPLMKDKGLGSLPDVRGWWNLSPIRRRWCCDSGAAMFAWRLLGATFSASRVGAASSFLNGLGKYHFETLFKSKWVETFLAHGITVAFRESPWAEARSGQGGPVHFGEVGHAHLFIGPPAVLREVRGVKL